MKIREIGCVKRVTPLLFIKKWLILFILVQLITVHLIFPSSLASNASIYNLKKITEGTWSPQHLWTDSEELYAVAVGDVDPSHPGDEVIVGGESEQITMVYGYGSSWKAEKLFKDDWYISALAIGDVYPPHPGNEIVVVGWSDKVSMIYKSSETNKWVSETLYDDIDWLYDVAIGDIDPTHPGNEIVFSGDPRQLRMLSYSNETSSWSEKTIWGNTPSDINVITIGDFDASHPGNECAVAGVNVIELNLTEILYNSTTGKWNVKDMGELEKEPHEMVVGDFSRAHPGNELALVSIQKHVVMIHEGAESNTWEQVKLWQDTESIQDVEIYDIFPEIPGNELLIVGNSKTVTILYEHPEVVGRWLSKSIYSGASFLNGIAIGDFDAFHSGPEFALLQVRQKLIKLHCDTKGCILYTPQQEYSVPTGNKITVPIFIVAEGGFSSNITLEVTNADSLLDNGISTEFNSNLYHPPTIAELNISISQATKLQSYQAEITCNVQTQTREQKEVYLNFNISVLGETEPAFNITSSPAAASVVADYSTEFQIKLDSINTWSSAVTLSINFLPPGVSYFFTDSEPTPPASTNLTLTTTSATPPGVYFITITARSKINHSNYQTCSIMLEVLRQSRDFEILIEPRILNITVDRLEKIDFYAISINNFHEGVSFKLEGLPTEISGQITPQFITPTSNSTIDLKATPGSEFKRYNLTIIGTSLDTKLIRSATFEILVLPAPPAFEMKIDPDSIIDPKSGEVGMIKLTITPEAGFSDDINITISGLKDDMAWNQELSPVMITEQKTIIINITGLNESGEFDLRLKARSPHYTRELEIPFEVTEEDIKPDVGSDIQTYNLVLILIIIIISIFIIKLLGKFTKKSETESENETKPKQKTQKTKRKITKNKRT